MNALDFSDKTLAELEDIAADRLASLTWRIAAHDELERRWTQDARERGSEAARAAASWIEPVEVNSARELLSKLEDGDPAVWDYLPARPGLSGAWADDLTPLLLAREITGMGPRYVVAGERERTDDDPSAELIDSLAQAFEDGVSEVFEDACVTELRKWAEYR